MKLTRRQFIKGAFASGAVLLVGSSVVAVRYRNGRRRFALTWDTTEEEPGTVTVVAVAIGADGTVLGRTEREYTIT